MGGETGATSVRLGGSGVTPLQAAMQGVVVGWRGFVPPSLAWNQAL